MSGAVKVTIQGKDRQTLIKLIKQERRNVDKDTVNFNTAQKRAVEFYGDHLKAVHRKLDPNDKYLSSW